MLVLIIGPSGVGKTNCGKHVATKLPWCQFFDLDELVEKRTGMPAGDLLPQAKPDGFFRHCEKEIDALLPGAQDEIVLVALGAGALESDLVRALISKFAETSITFIAPPEEVYKRGGKRNSNRNLAEFKEKEYSTRRNELYALPKHQVSVASLSKEEAEEKFLRYIKTLRGEA